MSEVYVEETCSENNLSWFRIIKILLAVVVGVVILLVIFLPEPISRETRERADRIKCMANMRNLGIAFYIYAQDNSNSYPTPEKWCDLLVMNYEVKLEYLVCKGSDAKIGESSYALNKNIAGKKYSEVPPDTVLLFETLGGWNQVGGSELLTTDNHKGEGCNVVFVDWHAEFVKAERIAALKWDTEKKDSESIE